jgi:hypothetical protein
MVRSSIAAALVAAISFVLADFADADTRYVAEGGSDAPDCTNPGAPCATVNYAVVQAVDGDTIQIGPGLFMESVSTGKALTFLGAGAGAFGGLPASTTLLGPGGTIGPGSPALQLQGGGTVRSIRIQGGHGGSNIGGGEGGGDAIDYTSAGSAPTSLHLEEAVVIGGNGGSSSPVDGTAGAGIDVRDGPGSVALAATESEFVGGKGFGGKGAIWLSGPTTDASLVDSRVPDEGRFQGAVVAFSGAHLTLESTDVRTGGLAATIYDGSLTIKRSRLLSSGTPLYVSASYEETPEAHVIDSLLVSEEVEALEARSEEQGSAAVEIRGSTLIGNGLAAVKAVREEGAGPATVGLRNTVVLDLPRVAPLFTPIDLLADGAQIDADYSSFNTRKEENGGSVSAPGSAHNVAADPQLIDPGNGVFVPRNTSPLVDRGDPGIAQAGELDLLGAPRSLDGNFDCVAAPDIGAFELTGLSAACVGDAKPIVSEFGMTNRVFAPAGGPKGGKRRLGGSAAKAVKRGTRFTYSLSEPSHVAIAIEKKARRRAASRRGKARFVKLTSLTAQQQTGHQATPFSGRVRNRPLKAGAYRATIVATDAAGQASDPQRVAFRIVAG